MTYRPDGAETICPACFGQKFLWPVADDQWFDFEHGIFLLAFCSNQSHKMHRFDSGAWNTQTEEWTATLFNSLSSAGT